MQEEFEKNMEQRLGNFSLQPSPMVWKEVDAALRPERKRRLAIWWLLPLLVLLAGTTAYLFFYSETDKPANELVAVNNKIINDNRTGDKSNNILQNDPAQKNKIEQKIILTESAQQNGKLQIIKTSADKKAVLIAKLQNANTTIPSLSFTSKAASQKAPYENSLHSASAANNLKNTYQQVPEIGAVTKFADDKKLIEKTGTTGKNDSLTALSSVVVTISDSSKKEIVALKKVDSSSNETNKAITKINKVKKQQWLITAGGGTLTVGENTLFSNNSAEKALSFSNSNVTPGNGTGASAGQNIYPLTAPTGGIQLNAGIQYQTTLSKRWKFNTGLSYHYLQNKQQVKQDTTAFFQSLGLADRLISSYANVPGKIITVTNYAHWLEVPLTFSYSLNPSSKNRVSLIAGGSMAWAFSEKWLISDAANSKYYYNTSLNNKLLFNINAGISFDLNNNLQLALMVKQSLTPIHKNVTDKFYYTQYSIQLSKPINFNKLFHKSSTKK